MQCAPTTTGSFLDSMSFLSSCCFFYIFFFCVLPVCYPFATSVLCRTVVRCLCGINVAFVFWIGVFLHVVLEVFVGASLCFQSVTVIENLVCLLLKRRVFCLWKRGPGLGE